MNYSQSCSIHYEINLFDDVTPNCDFLCFSVKTISRLHEAIYRAKFS